MEIQVSLQTQENRGDHGADVQVAIPAEPYETIQTVINRAAMMCYGTTDGNQFKHRARLRWTDPLAPTDVLEIRIVMREEY